MLVDENESVRTERGEILTPTSGSSRVLIDEQSRWYVDPKKPTDTIFKRRLEVRVRGFPDIFLQSCLNLYHETTIKVQPPSPMMSASTPCIAFIVLWELCVVL